MGPATITIAVALLLPGNAATRAEGKVVHATATRAYLDAGTDQGLALGSELVLHRAGAEVARCRVEEVAARAATCGARGARAGDGFALPAPPVREPPRLLPAPPAPEVVQAQAAALAAAPIATVEYTPPARDARRERRSALSAELSELVWTASGATSFTATRASVSARGAALGGGFRLDVDAQAVQWTSRPTDPAVRFRPGNASQLYVWQAGVSRDLAAGAATVSAGRVMPWRIPGATILDGAVAGWRFQRFEVGAFGGLVPDPSTLGLASDRATGGGYWIWDQPLGKGISLRDEGRIAMVRSPELGTRFEAETRAAARLGRALDLSGSLRLGFGGDVQAPGSVDAARVELSTRAIPHLRLAGWFAYDGLEVAADAEPMVYPGHSRRLEASGTWEGGRNVRVTLLGGTAADFGSGLDRSWVGPRVDLTRILFGRGGLSLGYLEELGWLDGRSAWLQLVGRPIQRLRLLARVSWSHASSLAVLQDEFGVALSAVGDLTQVFTARLTLSARGGLTGGAGGTQSGLTALATVGARY
jgi:hypothetical protein